jgi:uncharacterized membrane protein YphA (DoxX/SURF4 family)
MLNPFPDLLIYGIFAPLLIRVALGAALLYLCVEHIRARKEIAQALSRRAGKISRLAAPLLCLIEVAAGALLVVGAWTQVAALVTFVLTITFLVLRKSHAELRPLSSSAYMFMLAMSLSLLLSGAGAYAFDLPL